ncbi:DNA repair ATPase [Inhella proteolytica]|uniref:DNA repair ATPase n=1 Tax=Inhella proteolytica TaxID=2795029 RepID=A0A931J609_9BURK|nr:DNA repair ATPase [Inhella proteolytica]MBH9576952.1 DNA repair ATPase [Inhella proteolytica]
MTTMPDAADSASFELLKKRLATQGEALAAQTCALNDARLQAFGRSELALLLRTRARTENNCHARDLVRIGEQLLFGFNVFIGLRKETSVADVFALYRLGAGDELEALPLAGSFLDEARFTQDFRELYAYYKNATLIQLRVTADKLLAAFQIGQQLHDLRVFRWQIERDGSLKYIDNRGERDMQLPPTHDFEWTPTAREHQVAGRHPHVNILDTVFVETTGGDLTVKVENNTESGLGIYSEPVEDRNQSLADAEIAYARLGALILLRIKPYRETVTRYLVFNTRTRAVERIDAIGSSCVQLPEDHGILFPGGCYLQNGETKRFDLPEAITAGLRFKRMVRSPNGEDVLFVFYEPTSGHYALFTYNLINKALATPLLANGYARFPDGRVLVFLTEGAEPTRVHPMQLWQTPFFSEEHALAQPKAEGFFGRIGNAELVRGIAELNGIARALADQPPTRTAYEDLLRQCGRVVDAYFWLDETEAGGLLQALKAIQDGARATLTEFEKVEAIRQDTAKAFAQAEGQQRELLTVIASTLWKQPDDFIQALARLRERRGQLQLLKELRYADLARVQAWDEALATEQQRVGEKALAFLAGDKAFDSQRAALTNLAAELPQASTTTQIAALLATLDEQAAGLDLLTEQLGSLPGGDAVTRTQILDRISALYADINRLRAEARQRRKSMGAAEATAEFGAQFKLFGQAVDNAVSFADTPEACDEALTRLLAQLEELEGRFAEHDEFLLDITTKREAVVEAFAARRQTLVDARQRRAQAITDAAGRILDGLPRRLANLADLAAVHSLFAADPLVGKLRSLIKDLRDLGAAVAADELDTRLKTARDNALRVVRDQKDLASDGGKALKLGRHAFSVNHQALELTLVPRNEALSFHLTGTDYFAPVQDERLNALAPYWQQALVSETAELSRAEYLAGCVLQAALAGEEGDALPELLGHALAGPDGHAALLEAVRRFAAPRYQEGYQKGVHDEDAARLLGPLLVMQDSAGLLAFEPAARALAMRFWAGALDEPAQAALQRRARAAAQMRALFKAAEPQAQLEAELAPQLAAFAPDQAEHAPRAAAYLARQLAAAHPAWPLANGAGELVDQLWRALERSGQAGPLRHDLEAASPTERWQQARAWLQAFAQAQHPQLLQWLDDAASSLAIPKLPRERLGVELEHAVSGLLSEHPRIQQGQLLLNLNEFWRRFAHHQAVVLPAFQALQARRLELVQQEKQRLRLEQFQAKPLSSFVRNRLIDEVYLPLVGDNLAKQLGTAGEGARTDRMGLLLLISPPGYGKTTLMEYLAERLGLIFVRINCPALGHDITSVDPSAATHSAARQELEKLNLGLAMGNNVMLYLDDIQHTHPEFLQKFIALADGTRRMEGVWNGQPRSYDLRGKRFAIVMAGNPYTESGEVFKIPDMLANRADIYNLGDVLSGREQLFALSYIENALTANPALQPLASRDPADVHKLVRLAQGQEVPATDFAHPYSAAELDELRELMQRLFKARDLLLKVNLAYIESAAQADAYRSEPPFKLQGSYRNMGKLTAKITALMRDEELDALLRDHYRGEAQTLTSGAEENLLKLAHLLGSPTDEERTRWAAICEEYVKRRKLGGAGQDGHTRIAASLLDVAGAVKDLHLNPPMTEGMKMAEALLQLSITYRKILMPLVSATEKRLELDQSLHEQVERLARGVEGDPLEDGV